MIESKGGESIKGRTIKDWSLIEFRTARRRDARARRPGQHPVLPRGRRHALRDRHQPALRRSVPASHCGRQPLPRARARARPRRAARPRLGEVREGVVMTRFFGELTLVPDDDGTLRPQEGIEGSAHPS